MNRNVRKCLSAQGLWGLQESRQRERWNSETGQQVWSTFLEDRGSEEPRPPELGNDLRELVWKGIPGNMREEVYMSLSGEAIGCFGCPAGTIQNRFHVAAEIPNHTFEGQRYVEIFTFFLRCQLEAEIIRERQGDGILSLHTARQHLSEIGGRK